MDEVKVPEAKLHPEVELPVLVVQSASTVLHKTVLSRPILVNFHFLLGLCYQPVKVLQDRTRVPI